MKVPVRPRYNKLIGVIVFLSAAAIVLMSYLGSLTLKEALLRVGTIVSFISIPLWQFYERWGWQWGLTNAFGILCKMPNLNGRWIGVIDRGDARGAHTFVVEIYQRHSTITVKTFSSSSASESITATLVTDASEDSYELIYTWLGSGSRLDHETADPGMFWGTTHLHLSRVDSQLHLEGQYYTSRSPQQTRGAIRLIWYTKTYQNAFGNADDTRKSHGQNHRSFRRFSIHPPL